MIGIASPSRGISTPNTPSSVYAVVLHASRCTNNCVFCGAKDYGNIQNNVAAELGRLRESISRGERIDEVEISGNDPGEYPLLPKVVFEIRQWLPNAQIKLASHGKAFGDLSFLRQLIDSGVDHFIVPVYGHTSPVHDAVTRTSGSFVHTIRGLTNVIKSKAQFSITSLITRENQSFLKETLSFIADLTPWVSLGIPYLSLPTFIDSVPDIVCLKRQLSDALRSMRTERALIVRLRNIPRCLVDFEYECFEDSQTPPVGAYEHWRNQEMLGSGFVNIIQDQVIPRYRQFSKLAECRSCRFNGICSGFLTTYIDHGLVALEPIK